MQVVSWMVTKVPLYVNCGRGLQKEYDDDYKLCSCVCSKKGKRGQIRDQKILHHKWGQGILPPSLSLSFF